jgi:hypothetical protein
MKHALAILVLAASGAVAVSPAQAQGGTGTLFRSVASGPAESPPNTSPGFSITMIELRNGNTLLVDAPFKFLSAGTTAAHIHCCSSSALTGTAPIAVPFPDFPTGTNAGTYTRSIDLTSDASFEPAFLAANGGTASSATSALLAGMNANEAYVNIHTTANPNGEIRGFLVAAPIPEPGSWAMLGIGLAGLGLMARRRV